MFWSKINAGDAFPRPRVPTNAICAACTVRARSDSDWWKPCRGKIGPIGSCPFTDECHSSKSRSHVSHVPIFVAELYITLLTTNAIFCLHLLETFGNLKRHGWPGVMKLMTSRQLETTAVYDNLSVSPLTHQCFTDVFFGGNDFGVLCFCCAPASNWYLWMTMSNWS